MFNALGNFLIIFGVVFILLGIFLIFFERIPFFGKLPGDILIKKENFTFYFPLTSCILISAILTLIFYFIEKLK